MGADKQHITLRLAAHTVSLDIPREQEQAYREAGDFLNHRYLLYSQRMPQASETQLWLYVALEAALNWKSDARDKSLEPIEKKTHCVEQSAAKSPCRGRRNQQRMK